MKELNAAQKLLVSLGADIWRVIFGGYKRGRFPSNTKSGPGRIHLYGKKERIN